MRAALKSQKPNSVWAVKCDGDIRAELFDIYMKKLPGANFDLVRVSFTRRQLALNHLTWLDRPSL